MATAENKKPRSSSGVERKQRRKEILEKKKAIEELVKRAVAVKDHLAQFPAFHKYERNGISVYFESAHGDQLPLPTGKYIQNLLKVNMEGPYGSEWPSEEKLSAGIWLCQKHNLESTAQGKGLGKFLMQLIELIARKSQMGAVMLTVQKSNTEAMAFYNKLRYVISSTSPSRVDPLIGIGKSYEILCKTFEAEAKCKLEEGN